MGLNGQCAVGALAARLPASALAAHEHEAQPALRQRVPPAAASGGGAQIPRVRLVMRSSHASSVAALLETIGSGAVTAPFTEVKNSEVIIVIGANPTENHPVAATFFKNAKKNGSKLIVMDPRGQTLKKYANYMLQFKSGSDVALLNSIMHIIIKEDLLDRDYIEKHTEEKN